MPNFTVAASGGTPDWGAPAAAVGDDWARAFRAAASQLLATWRAADMDRLVAWGGGQAPLRGHADQQITELAVHSWDLAKATGYDAPLDPAIAEHALNWSQPMLRPEYRGPGQGFGAEVPVPQDAPRYDKLAGWFGRDPGWRPSANVSNRLGQAGLGQQPGDEFGRQAMSVVQVSELRVGRRAA